MGGAPDLTWAASYLKAESRLGLRSGACPAGFEQMGCVSECLVERRWELQPGRRRAIDILVRQPVTELLLFPFFFELLRAIYRNHLGAV